MPYIESKSDRRKKLRNGEPALTAGELNYQIFYYIKHNYNLCNLTNELYYEMLAKINEYVNIFLGKNPNYQKYNDMTGALIRCERELNRRLRINTSLLIEVLNFYDNKIAKYEDIKINENGDVE